MNKAWVVIKKRFNSIESLDIALIMTLILVFTYSEDVLGIRRPLQFITATGLIFYRFLGKSPYYWALVTVILTIGHSYLWFSIDNHKYLMNYWCFAISIALFFKDSKPVLKLNARLLIGLCFLFATFWKITNPGYVDGSFFEYLLVGGDDRFDNFSKFVTGISDSTLSTNKELINLLATVSSDSLELVSGRRVKIIAQIMTWWTVIIEGLIAVYFLFGKYLSTYKFKDYILAIFIVSTYPIATVIGFGWLISAMGAAQVNNRDTYIKVLYLFMFIFLAIFSDRALRYSKTILDLFHFF